ncbi:hypothetical protein EV715DRAFT_210276 [Schizophyllum commune]
MSAVLSESISQTKKMQDCPIVDYKVVDLDEGRYRRQIEHFEYYWGLQKGDLDLSSPLNHIRLRADMAEGLTNLQWVLIPTQDTLRRIRQLAEYNQLADMDTRKHCLKELPGKLYEYDFIPLYYNKYGRATLYVNRGKTTKTVRPPYTSMPPIRTRAHPLFVAYMAKHKLDMSSALVMPEDKAREITLSVGDIVRCWRETPPSEFLIGPDVWREHRHPLSDDGKEADSCAVDVPLHDSRKGYMTLRSSVRKTTRAPCRQARTVSSMIKPYTRKDPLPVHERPSALPRPGVKCDDERRQGTAYPLSQLRAWVDGTASQSQKRTARSCWRATWLDEEAQLDELLAQYRMERARDADNALDPHTNVMYTSGTVLGMGTDWAGYSSNNWASRIHGVCLLGENVFAQAAK